MSERRLEAVIDSSSIPIVPLPENPPSRAGSRRWILVAAALFAAAVLALFWFGWSRDGFQWALFINTFRKLDPFWLMAAALLALSTYLGRAIRWRVLIRPIKPVASLWNLFSATAIGFTAIVLFGRPGEMVRPLLIANKERLSFSSQVAAWFLERIYDLLMALLIFGFALSRVQSSGARVGEGLQWVLSIGGQAVGGLATICLFVLLMLRLFSEVARRRLLGALTFLPPNYYKRAEELITSFTHGVGSTRSALAVAQVFLLSVLEWVIIVGCNVCLFRAFPETAHFQLMDVLIFVGFVSFGSVVQIPGIGGGMQIVSIVVLTELFGMPLEFSTGVALVLWIITFVVIVPFGLLLAFREGLNWRKLRQLEQQAERLSQGAAS